MDTKRMVITAGLLLVVVFLWSNLVKYFQEKYPELRPQQQQTNATTQPSAATQPSTTQPVEAATHATTQALSSAPATTAPSVAVGALRVLEGEGKPGPAALGSATRKDPVYAMQLNVADRGAGLGSVTLNDFLQNVDKPEAYVFQRPYEGREDQSRALATRSITVDGQTLELSNVAWSVRETAPTSATYGVTVGTGDGKPLLDVTKRYTVFPRKSTERPALGFEILVEYGFKNLSGRRLNVKTDFNGAVMPPREISSGPDQQILTGYRDGRLIEI